MTTRHPTEAGAGVLCYQNSHITIESTIIAFGNEGEAVACYASSDATLACCDPNPFTQLTQITCRVPGAHEPVQLVVCDAVGRPVPAGVYFCSLRSEGRIATVRLLRLR